MASSAPARPASTPNRFSGFLENSLHNITPKVLVTLFGFVLIIVFLMPLGYMITVAFKQDQQATERPEVSTALRRSYNRWLADRCAQSHGRLRWVCLPPLMNMDETIKELQFAKDHGACGILKKGDLEAGKWPADQYFHPLYEEANRLPRWLSSGMLVVLLGVLLVSLPEGERANHAPESRP